MPGDPWRVTSKRTHPQTSRLSNHVRACPCLARNKSTRSGINIGGALLWHCVERLQVCIAGVDLFLAPNLSHGTPVKGKHAWAHPVPP